jgi:hypothetical protein
MGRIDFLILFYFYSVLSCFFFFTQLTELLCKNKIKDGAMNQSSSKRKTKEKNKKILLPIGGELNARSGPPLEKKN